MYLYIKIRININELKQFKEIWTNLVILYKNDRLKLIIKTINNLKFNL